MGLDTAQVTSRANSDLCNVDRFAGDVTLSPEVRMEMIGAYVDQYRAATRGSVGQIKAEAYCRERFALIWSITERARAYLKGGR